MREGTRGRMNKREPVTVLPLSWFSVFTVATRRGEKETISQPEERRKGEGNEPEKKRREEDAPEFSYPSFQEKRISLWDVI